MSRTRRFTVAFTLPSKVKALSVTVQPTAPERDPWLAAEAQARAHYASIGAVIPDDAPVSIVENP